MIDEKLLATWLKRKSENDWLDFKRKWKLFDTSGNLNVVERDELIKDVLGLANGNSKTIRKTKYLIIGADDKQFDTSGVRVLYDVDYRVPTQSEITKWVNDACTPSVVGIECDYASIDSKNLYIVTIPSTFDLHETTRELNAKGHHGKYTVFMRQDEHTLPASVRDGITIQQLKFLYRQEILNPSAVRSGAIVGAIVALLLWNSGYKTPQPPNEAVIFLLKILATIFGIILGAEIGWAYQRWNSVWYDWRYYSPLMKFLVASVLFVSFLGLALLLWQSLQGG